MPLIKILSKTDIRAFDFPPVFNIEERKYFFSLPNWVEGWIESLKTATNKAGFMLQLGYFLATNRFFVASRGPARIHVYLGGTDKNSVKNQ